MATLAEIQAKLLEQAKGNSERPAGAATGDNASFPFWNTPEGQSSVIRFLPDGDTDNTFFWQERQIIKLPFQGVTGRDDQPCEVQVPCVDMFGDQCPITAAIRPWWKDESKKDLARVYYKKRSYLFQGFVVNSAFEEPTTPENPIRRFIINPSIYEIIKNSLMNPEMEDLPTDYVGGRDFKLTKTKKGDYANYGTSQWSFKVRGLNADELGAIEQYSLWNLKEFLGNRPDRDGIEMIRAMFEDSLAGRPFDTASYGSVYRVVQQLQQRQLHHVPHLVVHVKMTKKWIHTLHQHVKKLQQRQQLVVRSQMHKTSWHASRPVQATNR
jgi:hypothetical protein